MGSPPGRKNVAHTLLVLFPNGSWSDEHPGTGSQIEPIEEVPPNLTDPAGSQIEPAGCSTPPLPSIWFASRAGLLAGSCEQSLWAETLVERRGRHFLKAASSPLWSEDSFASHCPRNTYWIPSDLCFRSSLHSFKNPYSAPTGGRAAGSP